MRTIVIGLDALSLSVCVTIGTSVSAHHAVAAKFDPGKPLTLRGIITGIDWFNPHVHLFVNVTDASGRTARSETISQCVEADPALARRPSQLRSCARREGRLGRPRIDDVGPR